MNELWSYASTSTRRWSLGPVAISPSPQARGRHCFKFNSVHSRSFLFGGVTFGSNFLNDIWSFNHASVQWTNESPVTNNPAARADHACAVDTVLGSFLVHGGYLSATFNPSDYSDLWSFNYTFKRWTRLDAGTADTRLSGHAMVYGVQTNSLYIIFGEKSDNSLPLGVYVYSLPASTGWSAVSNSGFAATGRKNYAEGFNPATGDFYLFGGADATRNYSMFRD